MGENMLLRHSSAMIIQRAWEYFLKKRIECCLKNHKIAAYYINLDKSKDRRKDIEELDFVIPLDRFKARYDKFGELGCALSHYFLLERAYKDDNDYIIILEDDFTISNNIKYKRFFIRFIDLFGIAKNQMLLSYREQGRLINKDRCFDKFLKLESCNTTTGYVIKRTYIPKLTNILRDCINFLRTVKRMNKGRRWLYRSLFPIDQIWDILQERDNWYVYYDSTFMYQKSGESIIGRKTTDFKDLFTTSYIMSENEIAPFKDLKWKRLLARMFFYYDDVCLEWLFEQAGIQGSFMRKQAIYDNGIVR